VLSREALHDDGRLPDMFEPISGRLKAGMFVKLRSVKEAKQPNGHFLRQDRQRKPDTVQHYMNIAPHSQQHGPARTSVTLKSIKQCLIAN